jgi:hypothetical protein
LKITEFCFGSLFRYDQSKEIINIGFSDSPFQTERSFVKYIYQIMNHRRSLPDKMISEEKKDVVRNLYLSGIGEEFIAMQLDLEIPIVISVLKELGIHRSEKKE